MRINVGGEVVAVNSLQEGVAGVGDGTDVGGAVAGGGIDRLGDLHEVGVLDGCGPINGHRYLGVVVVAAATSCQKGRWEARARRVRGVLTTALTCVAARRPARIQAQPWPCIFAWYNFVGVHGSRR